MRKPVIFLGTMLAAMAAFVGQAYAAADASVVQLASDSGTSIKDTFLAVVVILIPLAVGVFLARKALPIAKRLIGV